MFCDRNEKRRRMPADDLATSLLEDNDFSSRILHQERATPLELPLTAGQETITPAGSTTKKMCLGNTTKESTFPWAPSFPQPMLAATSSPCFPPMTTAGCVSNSGPSRCPCSPFTAQWGAFQLPTPERGCHVVPQPASWGNHCCCSSSCCSRRPNSYLGSVSGNVLVSCTPVVFPAPVNCCTGSTVTATIGIPVPYRPLFLSGGVLLQETKTDKPCDPCSARTQLHGVGLHNGTSLDVSIKGSKRSCLSNQQKDVNDNVTHFSVPSPSTPIAEAPPLASVLGEQDPRTVESDISSEVLLRPCSSNYGNEVVGSEDLGLLATEFLRQDEVATPDGKRLTQRVPDYMERVYGNRSARNFDLLRLRDTAQQLRQCQFYYEGLDWKESVRLLEKTEFGTFLVRDSSDPRYLYALSVQTERGPTSVRLQYSEGRFRLDAEARLIPRMPLFDSVLALVDYYVEQTPSIHKKGQVWLDHHGQLYSPILLRKPLLKQVPSLQHMSRLACNRHPVTTKVKWHETNALPVTLVDYLGEYPFNH